MNLKSPSIETNWMVAAYHKIWCFCKRHDSNVMIHEGLSYKNNLSLIQNKKRAVQVKLSKANASPSVSILIISLVHSNRQFQVPF